MPSADDPFPDEYEEEEEEDVERDAAEHELVSAAKRTRADDPLAAYDVDVSEEGAIIVQHLALLASRLQQGQQQGQANAGP